MDLNLRDTYICPSGRFPTKVLPADTIEIFPISDPARTFAIKQRQAPLRMVFDLFLYSGDFNLQSCPIEQIIAFWDMQALVPISIGA
jgi:hypothetical protein